MNAFASKTITMKTGLHGQASAIRMRPWLGTLLVAAGLIAWLGGASPRAAAATDTWNGSSDYWSTDADWSSGAWPQFGLDAVLPGNSASSYTVNFDADYAGPLNSLVLN